MLVGLIGLFRFGSAHRELFREFCIVGASPGGLAAQEVEVHIPLLHELIELDAHSLLAFEAYAPALLHPLEALRASVPGNLLVFIQEGFSPLGVISV